MLKIVNKDADTIHEALGLSENRTDEISNTTITLWMENYLPGKKTPSEVAVMVSKKLNLKKPAEFVCLGTSLSAARLAVDKAIEKIEEGLKS